MSTEATTPAPTAPGPTFRAAVSFYSYPKLLFIWPLIVAGFVLWPFAAPTSSLLEVYGWIYLSIGFLVLLTMGLDIERNVAFFIFVTFLALVFLGMYLDAQFESFTLIGDVYRWFADRDVKYDRSFGLVLSIILLIPYVTMLVWVRMNDKWRITHNEFEHHSWGRADDSLARGAKRVRSTYPDLLELLICGAGTLIVYSASGRSELRRIPHVPMLPLLRRRIDKLLESVAVSTAAETVALDEEADGEIAPESDAEGSASGDKDRL